MTTKDKTPDNLYSIPSAKLQVGDLVSLDLDIPKYKILLGVIVKIKPEVRFNPPPLNVFVWWCDGDRSWCLGENLILVSSIEEHLAV